MTTSIQGHPASNKLGSFIHALAEGKLMNAFDLYVTV